jgi:multiple antibiotic resistance protein
MTLNEYVLLAFSSLFVIVDPIALVPAFIAMTPNNPPALRLRMARLACVVAAGVLMLFALGGKWIFKALGITLPAFQIAGGILLFRIALDMLYARRSATQETTEEVEAGTEKEDIAITPLAVPMLAGPGAISTALILMSQAETWDQMVALHICIAAVCFCSYVIFYIAARSMRLFSPLALKLITRIMGLILAAIAVQFMINALRQMGVELKGT